MIRAPIAVLLSVVMLLIATAANAGLDEALVFYLTFDEATDQRIVDTSSNGLDAGIIENTKIVKGKYGDAIHITDDGQDCVNIPSQEKLKITGEITMMLWVYYQTPWQGKRTHFFDKDCHTGGSGASYGIMSADIGTGPEIWLFLGSRDNQGNVIGRKALGSVYI